MTAFIFQVDDQPHQVMADLPSIAAAKCEAARHAGRLLCDSAETFWGGADLNLTVFSETHLALFALSISGTDSAAIRVFPKA